MLLRRLETWYGWTAEWKLLSLLEIRNTCPLSRNSQNLPKHSQNQTVISLGLRLWKKTKNCYNVLSLIRHRVEVSSKITAVDVETLFLACISNKK